MPRHQCPKSDKNKVDNALAKLKILNQLSVVAVNDVRVVRKLLDVTTESAAAGFDPCICRITFLSDPVCINALYRDELCKWHCSLKIGGKDM